MTDPRFGRLPATRRAAVTGAEFPSRSALSERVEWHAGHFEPIEERVSGLVYEDVRRRREWLGDLEECAFDRFLAARAVASEDDSDA